MEVLFENHHVRNKQAAKEIYFYFYFQRTLFIVCYCLLALSFLANLLALIFEGSSNIGLLVFVPFFFLLQFFLYSKQKNDLIKRDLEVHGKEISAVSFVYDDHIQVISSTGSDISLKYENVAKVIQTKNLILLRTKANQLFIFGKDTFTTGNKEDFILFLRSKGLKVK